jgi:hypothetical protein
MWLSLAATAGDKDAKEIVDAIAKAMTPDQIAEGQRLARAWKPN